MSAIDLLFSVIDELNPERYIELSPKDKLDDMLQKNDNLKLLINQFDLTL